MIIPIKAVIYFFSLFLLTTSLLFFVTLGSIFCSFLYKKMGDDSSWESGFSSLNPLNHIDYFVIIFFIFTGWLIGIKRPAFFNNWKKGLSGILQKLIYLFVPTLFHLFIASLLLFIGVYFFSYEFLLLSFKTSLKVSSSYIYEVITLLKIKGPKLIFALFFLYSVILNLNLALLDFLFSLLDYIIKKYFFEQMLNIKFIFLLYGIIMLMLYIFGNKIMYLFWNIIITPLILLF
jgi:hypothetical protein